MKSYPIGPLNRNVVVKAGSFLLAVPIPAGLPAGTYRIVISATDPKSGRVHTVRVTFVV